MDTSLIGRIVPTGGTGEKGSTIALPGGSTFWAVLIFLGIFLYLFSSILPPFFIGAMIAYVLSPVVDRFQARWGIPRLLAILITYVLIVGPLLALLILGGPRLLVETRQLVARSPFLLTQIIIDAFGEGPYDLFGSSVRPHQVAFDLIESLRNSLGTPTTALHLVTGLAELTLNAFLTMIVSLYLLGDTERVEQALLGLFPKQRRAVIRAASAEIHRTLARYLRRQALLVALVATVTFLGLELIFHMRYALPLAVATGFVEIVPFLGPILAAGIAALIALSQGGVELAAGVVLFYVIVRQIEDQVVMPVVLGGAVELHPLLVIFAVLAGQSIGGILGALLAVPIAASIKVVLDYWPRLIAAETESPPTEVASPITTES